jgi:hypothetical protein
MNLLATKPEAQTKDAAQKIIQSSVTNLLRLLNNKYWLKKLQEKKKRYNAL